MNFARKSRLSQHFWDHWNMSLPNCKILDKFLTFNPFPSASFWAGDYKNWIHCTKLMERNLDVRFISTDVIKDFHPSGVPLKWHGTVAVEVLNCKCWFASDTSNRAFDELKQGQPLWILFLVLLSPLIRMKWNL